MVTPSMSGSEFGICFELGRALRRGDVEAFFNVYDKLIPKNAQVSSFTLTHAILQLANLQIEGVKETARLISELSWSEYSLVEDAFGDPNTPVAKRNIDFHYPLPFQLEKIMHEIKGDIEVEDSGTLSDMDSLSSETDDKMMKDGNPDGESYQMAGIEVGGFAITCELDDKMNVKKHDYMYEIGSKHKKTVEIATNTKYVQNNEVKTGEDGDNVQEATSLPPPVPPSQPAARPRSAPILSSLQQRRSSHIQLKSFSTTSLPSHQPKAAINQEKRLTNYKPVSMNNQFPKWLYSEVVKAGLQFSKPSFFRSHSSSSLSSCSDSESTMDKDSTTTDSSEQQVMQAEEEAINGDISGNSSSCVSSTTQDMCDTEQFNHYEAICYLWRGI